MNFTSFFFVVVRWSPSLRTRIYHGLCPVCWIQSILCFLVMLFHLMRKLTHLSEQLPGNCKLQEFINLIIFKLCNFRDWLLYIFFKVRWKVINRCRKDVFIKAAHFDLWVQKYRMLHWNITM